MKVLSLFDGISCGRVALERAGIQVEQYTAYEIDKYAIRISQHNWPDIVQMGDVTTADFTQYEGVDLLIGGSPCQGFSFAGKQLNCLFSSCCYRQSPRYFRQGNKVTKKPLIF